LPPKSSAACLRDYVLPRSLGSRANTHANAAEVVQGGADVKREDRRSVRERWRAVIVNNISDFFAGGRTPDDPVVAVKWGFVA